jgi:hypothetical protein
MRESIKTPRIVTMDVDPSWDAAPVVDPDLPGRKARKLYDHAVLNDPVGLAEPAYQYQDREHVVVPSSLDQPSRELLLRAQNAIATAADAATDIEPGDVVPESTLLRHEWEIAAALRDITELRAEHAQNTAGSVGPMTEAVLKSQEGALVRAHDAIAARVSGLERYADCVSAAAVVYRDWRDSHRVAGRNDMYLDLVARTAADEHAAAEIGDITDRATTARAFQQVVQQLSLAASALELP